MRLLLTLAGAIFVIETLIMFGLEFVKFDNHLIATVIDSFILTALLFPLLYYAVFKVITAKNDALTISERNLLAARDELERRVNERTADLAEVNKKLERSIKVKTDFLASMSHELRTPLNAILGFSELIRGQCFGPIGNQRYADYAGDIHTSGALLLSVINDILDLAKMEAGKTALNETDFDATAVIDAAMRVIEPQAAKAGVSMIVVPPARPLHLCGDERRLTQVLLNLMSNAVKFTPAGGRITITASVTDAGEPQLSVADTGIGIAAEDMKRVMEPFVQIESTMSRRHSGSGLGLAIVRSLVERHGGRIELESEPRRGTTVRMTLPASRLID